jgi:large subunit ribosomal protein L25
MDVLDFNVKGRNAQGKGGARSLRREGRVPAVLYGPKSDAAALSFVGRDFERQVGEGVRTQLLRLQSDDAAFDQKLVQIKDTQRHPISHSLVHADFYEVDVNEKITVEVPLDFVGLAAGVDRGGILQPIRRVVEVLCLPLEIPDEFQIDVTGLDIGDAFHLRDLKVAEGIEFLDDPDITLVTVAAPVVEETRVAEGEEEVAAAPAEGEKTEKKEESGED